MTASSRFIDFTQEDQLSLPCLPLVSSCRAGWNRIQLALYRQPPYCIPEHYSPHHVICINAGTPVTLQQTVDGKSKTIDSIPGGVGIYPANRWQTFYWHQEAEFLQLYLEPMLLNQLGTELYDKDQIELIPQLTSCIDPLIYQIAIALKTTLETDGVGSKLYSDLMANALAVHILCRYSTNKSSIQHDSGRLSDQQLDRVINYIDEHLDQNLSLAELAALARLSSYHFARLFKRSTGIAPHQYHIRRRVERAKRLLLARELSIAEVAQVVGFASQGHLNYHFKRVVGIAPKAFLRQ
ncbi:helix-turn-helix domain-containing protein [Gloeobacter violaceus]|uniref:Gll3227 protein n=1 Tax=Gloeobacter violaceus (strain ATCC 29082 / PCC 7421) TaxID=251221 RepID=Q7NGE4_GLOVI|nr:AraC family transcriptional regulator [Gloeobacter violaceus]BAC91168.1 gll3227 [Gloeobacter violaceus PCC 7421]